jgi:UDP-N-acetyl-D-glucosamine/UDP-N-acetyl-D-galactosamine dehydrogenase
MNYKNKKDIFIGVIGLGYVGLPLAIEFSKYFNVTGLDKNSLRVKLLNKNQDINSDVKKEQLLKNKAFFTSNIKDLQKCNFYIITVPTPIYKNKKPNLKMIGDATKSLTKVLKKNDTVVLESTVYPGVTENFVGSLISKKLKFKLNTDFFLGYSPERINPGDKIHTLTNIKKLVSGSNKKTLDLIYNTYAKIIKKGVVKVDSIKIAEAAKVIENSQRDVNIALMNEFNIIFDKMNINSNKVFKAAYTKWNFLKFKPGLVGGHCIGIDPYYLIYAANKFKYQPKIIKNARQINDDIPNVIFKKIKRKFKYFDSSLKFLILGATFKENCSDIRNSKVNDVFNILNKNNLNVKIFDPIAVKKDMINLYGKNAIFNLKDKYDLILFLVPHNYFVNLGLTKLKNFLNKNGSIFDYKYIYSNEQFLI